MSLRLATLGSGSRGNATLVESGDTLIMIDCGLPRRTLEVRMRAVGRSASDITAVLVSHEHGDHIAGLGPFQRRYRKPVWLTPGTGGSLGGLPERRSLNCHGPLTIGSIEVEPFPVPHDAREPCQFVFQAGKQRLGFVTDTGHVTSHMKARLSDCDALAIEANHDVGALRRSDYPESVKVRVASRFGHLNNEQTAEFVGELSGSGLQWVAALHLSERCNSPDRVRTALEPALGAAVLHVAAQDEATAWLEIA
jgi:phosphoribosyl 1,2-cyclic phosphodiesterase